jgi:copper chaperone CopZ
LAALLLVFPYYGAALYPTAKPTVSVATAPGGAPIWQTRTYRIQGMTCEACARHVESAVQQVPGVQSVAVSYDQATAQVRYNSAQARAAQVESAINSTGYHVQNPTR